MRMPVMTIPDGDWAAAVERLSAARTVALACHVEPDGDALGSMLALHRLLRRRGVDVSASWGSADSAAPGRSPGHSPGHSLVVPPQYTFLPELDHLVLPADMPADPDVFVALDCASPDRLGTLRGSAEAAGCVIVIDHHVSGSAFGDIRLIEPDVAATVVLVDELITRLGGSLDREMAMALYVGLVTDTGRFTYASTTPEVMALGARLIAHGFDHVKVNRRVWETHSFGYLKVLGRALERAVIEPSVGLVWTAVTQDDLADLGVDLAETEGLIDVLRAVEAAECALVCKELPDGTWNTSLRSKGAVDVGSVAEQLGGGGHAFAAGFRAVGDLPEVVRGVVARLERQAAERLPVGEPVGGRR
jgi:bifunctional oligoribonuclease and PAP phosphatase NrnA